MRVFEIMPPMTYLVIDSSGPEQFLLIGREGRLIETHLFSSPRSQARDLSALLESLRPLYRELKFIAIGTGPGSFTGTRIGAQLARTLAYTLNIQVVPFCSLKAFAPETEGPFQVTVDAKSNFSYALSGEKRDGATSYHLPATLLKEPPKEPLPLNFENLCHLAYAKWQVGQALSPENLRIAYLKRI